MATIKSYTNLEQSKKLAKILPIKSADMVYVKKQYGTNLYNVPLFHYEIEVQYPEYMNMDFCIPCWSLTALLGVLHNYTLQTNTDGTVFVVCESKKPMISDAYYNPVDACYEMILKLHELNLL